MRTGPDGAYETLPAGRGVWPDDSNRCIADMLSTGKFFGWAIDHHIRDESYGYDFGLQQRAEWITKALALRHLLGSPRSIGSMSVYKYVSSEAALRYLSTWALRITPPDQFNDPFELRPRFTGLTEGYFQRQGPQALTRELKAQIVPVLSPLGLGNLPAESTDALADYLLGTMSPEREALFIDACQTVVGVEMSSKIAQLRESVAPVIEKIWKSAQEMLPTVNRALEERMQSMLPKMLGILCLSRSGKHPLMWSHYAESHSGALLEFDEGHTTFRRRRSSVDEFGFLRTVRYSDTRPTLGADDTEEDSFANLALTKALEWAYEQEVRWLWPLEEADKIVKAAWGEVHLVTVPASALRSITLGCKATVKLVEQVVSHLRRNPEAIHVKIKRAHIDSEHFALNYLPLA